MKILLVASVDSIHTARWTNQLAATGWDVHLCHGAPLWTGVAPELRYGTVHLPFSAPLGHEEAVSRRSGTRYLLERVGARIPFVAAQMQRRRNREIAQLIAELKPDVVHSLALNVNWSNLTLPVLYARQALGPAFSAPWVYSSWGTDLDYYAAQSTAQQAEARALLTECDYYIAECDRDIRLAKELGFSGELLGKLPAFGGVDSAHLESLRQEGPVSARTTIFLKGRDCGGGGDPVGRAMTAMRAFELCRSELEGFRIVIGQASPVVAEEARRLASSGMSIEVLPRLPYDELLRIVGSSRVSIALTVNDGLPNHLVEALALGALPLHSNLEPIAEWVEDGVNGLLVGAEDLEGVTAALRRALTDDELVDRGAEVSARLVDENLSDEVVRPKVIAMYQKVAEQGPIGR